MVNNKHTISSISLVTKENNKAVIKKKKKKKRLLLWGRPSHTHKQLTEITLHSQELAKVIALWRKQFHFQAFKLGV
jgi:hypothetical protein